MSLNEGTVVHIILVPPDYNTVLLEDLILESFCAVCSCGKTMTSRRPSRQKWREPMLTTAKYASTVGRVDLERKNSTTTQTATAGLLS